MIENLRSMAVFAAVVEEGSFKAAGEKLNLSPSVISHHITKLETRLECSLLLRTSRNLSLTSKGALLFNAAKEMSRVAGEGLDQLAGKDDALGGPLRVCLPSFLVGGVTADIVEDFLLAHPRVQLEIDYVRGLRHPIDDGFDLVISTQKIDDKLLSCREFQGRGAGIYAAPDLAERINPLPLVEVPKKIPVLTTNSFSQSDWREMFSRETDAVFGDVKFRMKCDDAAMLYRVCLSGAGLAILPNTVCVEDLARGRLVKVLQEVKVKQVRFFAAWRTISPKTALVLQLVNHIARSLPKSNGG